MEQSILTVEEQRWANAIVKLTSWTYANKLVWVKSFLGTNGTDGTAAEYNADFEGQRFRLTVSRPEVTDASSWSRLLGMPGYLPKSTISLQAFDRHGARVVDVPNLSVLQPLADAVQSQADTREESVLDAIEAAAI